ncbi:Glutamate decarboxylase 1 [Melipona quadrifasciata]|uniref:Glutamate decarboxylase 1 n=1 Tax=Melipona quadrifasciata TaxID=166423 RepID=A0A0M9AB86_9HYME|nr:Glutamate decarboxylase 1 [Melipona quadrifasciata]
MDAPTSTEATTELLKRLLEILDEENALDRTGSKPVLEFVYPEDLQIIVCILSVLNLHLKRYYEKFNLQRKLLPIELTDEPASKEEIETVIRQTIRYSVKTFSPHFHNQLYAGIDEYGLAGSWLTDVLNTSQYTYEVAPVFTMMEQQVIEQSLKLVGYPPLPEGDGILCPGGSLSNMYGMVMARYKMIPDVKRKGLAGLPQLVCFTSEAGHYSITKGAHWLGLGTDNVYKVKCDEFGRMRPDDLQAGIAEVKRQGHLPFFVNATCGTTVLCSFDPLPEIAAICREENLWLHVDACLGGTLLLSEKYRDRLKGIELSNSVAWNPHKMLGAPLQCSLFLIKGKNTLHEANCVGARYLFQQDKHYDVSWDTGDKSLQCGRKVDGAKLWLMWKARGTKGLCESVEVAMSAVEYIPPSMRTQEETQEWWDKLYEITAKVKGRMMLEGTLMVGYTPLSYCNLGNFFRMVVTCQPPPSNASMDYVIDKIEELAADFEGCQEFVVGVASDNRNSTPRSRPSQPGIRLRSYPPPLRWLHLNVLCLILERLRLKNCTMHERKDQNESNLGFCELPSSEEDN